MEENKEQVVEENTKPVTSEEFNKQLREEKGLPEKEKKEEKANAVTILMIIIFILSFVAGLTVIIAAIVTVVNKSNEMNAVTPKGGPEPVEKKVVELKETDIKDYESIINYIIKIRGEETSYDVSKVTNQQMLVYGLSNAKQTGEKWAKKDVKEAIGKAFGNKEYKDEDILCFVEKTPLYEYDSEKEEYFFTTKYEHGHGGDGGYDRYYFFQSAEKDEEKGILTIKYKIIYGIYQSDIVIPKLDLFTNAKDASEEVNQIYTSKEGDYEEHKEEIVNKVYEENKDKLPTTTFIFEKDSSGNYAFKSVESK